MCGIAGLMTLDGAPPDARILDALSGALVHRGPDGVGRFVGPGIGLVQTRLAIIDLVTGDQPLYGPEGTVAVVNGEIYNYVELRERWKDARYQTQSDCEMPLHAFARAGAGFARDLRGMYAAALYDPADATIYLARDPFGIKPFYYAETPAGFVFASEPRAILATGLVQRRLDLDKALELLQLQFTTGRETAVAGIARVLPGETLTVRQGRIVGRARIAALPDGDPERISEDDALARLDAALRDSVLVHQRSDVPYGMFLSGGVDSTALLAMMAELNDRPVRAYTAGFPESGAADERMHAAAVAEALGAEHVEIGVTEADFWRDLPCIAAAVDDPAADYAIVPTYALARRAAEDLKVVLCGEGGDELFAGYGRYRTVMRPRWLGGRSMRSKGQFDGLDVLRDPGFAWRDGVAALERTLMGAYGSTLQRAQALDCADWLPNDLLVKLDRCLMAHGLEGRTPFLDPAIAAASFRLPDKLKIEGRLGKMLLRKWLNKRLPMAGAFDRKRGFTVPVGEWIARQAKSLGPLVSRVEGVQRLCQPGRVEALFARADGAKEQVRIACWRLLYFALWHRIHIDGRDVAGDVRAQLEE